MKRNNNISYLLSLFLILGISVQVQARPNVNTGQRPTGQRSGLLKTTATCKPAENAIDLDINNVRARLMTGGDMWWDIGTAEARYEVPKGTRKNALFAGSVWIGGYDAQGQLKVAAQTYRQDGNDYWPGPLNPTTAEVTASECSEWDRFWKVNRETISRFRELGDYSQIIGDADYEAIYEWPAKGNGNAVGRNGTTLDIPNDRDFAPFIDVNTDGVYNPLDGDYPDIDGDQYIWWVFNDKGNVKNQSNTEGIGIEVQASAFAFSTKDYLNDATFYNYRLVNRGNLSLDSTYISTWTDADLGFYRDDYIGCDTSRGLGILYNGRSVDGEGQINSYGSQVPMVGVDFFKGPVKKYDSAGVEVSKVLSMEAFTYYNNDNTIVGNPRNGVEIYYYMTGSIRNGQRFSNDFKGANVNSRAYGEGPITKYVYYGDPGEKTEWSECTCNNPVGDRRFVHSAGPFTLEPGVVNDVTIGAVWVSETGGCPNTSFKKIRVADDQAQSLFESNFETIEGPEAPRMVIREMDRKLVAYLLNDPLSTNYQERYGYDTAKKYRVVSNKAARIVGDSDSVYRFEGYRVFQLKNREVQPAQIFNERGEVDNSVAVEIFQCDINNGVTRIVNYDKSVDISDSTYIPVVKVDGADSGISHSFEILLDQFATGDDKRLVNYRNYYFVAVAYAYNEFAPFDINLPDSTQDVAYLESAHGAGGSPIEVSTAMPNPSNGNMGTVLNSDYGSGVSITRIEGRGNGGNVLQLSDESELEALTGVPSAFNSGRTIHQSIYPKYKPGSGPIGVKVVDPLKVQAHDWQLMIEGTTQVDPNRGLDSFTSSWTLLNKTTGDTITAEKDLSILNDQILEKYGISVEVMQVGRPGDNQEYRNGYLTSTVSFVDQTQPWLSGVQDGEQSEPTNWIRSGRNADTSTFCNYNDYTGPGSDTVLQIYEKMLDNNSLTRGTFAPYSLGSDEEKSRCGFGVTRPGSRVGIFPIPSIDLVYTSDKSKWTRCVVIEMQESTQLAENGAEKWGIRRHASWTGEVNDGGRPVYSTVQNDTGMSWFPGYAINQETGERLNILFAEDSWLKEHNGGDMIWNPTSDVLIPDQFDVQRVYGGKHYVYVLNSRYDSCRSWLTTFNGPSIFAKNLAWNTAMWVHLPTLNPAYKLRSLANNLIPTETRIRARVTRPYATYRTNFNRTDSATALVNEGKPVYEFSTKGLAPTPLSDNPNADKQVLLDRIHAVPNPYYGYTGYEQNRLDTRVRIINLPTKATVSIYSLDGALIQRLEKDNPNVSYIDWDIRNNKGLPIASGMYLMHVSAEGIGETVLRWFGAMRPIDVTTY